MEAYEGNAALHLRVYVCTEPYCGHLAAAVLLDVGRGGPHCTGSLFECASCRQPCKADCHSIRPGEAQASAYRACPEFCLLGVCLQLVTAPIIQLLVAQAMLQSVCPTLATAPQEVLGRQEQSPALMGRSGSVPDNFGSASPASWCVTSGEVGHVSPGVLRGEGLLGYAASDAQVRLRGWRDLDMLANDAHLVKWHSVR